MLNKKMRVLPHMNSIFNPIWDGPFRGCSRMMGGEGVGQKSAPYVKIYQAYPTMMKLGTVVPYLKKIEKCMNSVKHPLSSADISIFYWKSENFTISRNTYIDCILIHNF